MKLHVGAQLPARLSRWLIHAGHDAQRTTEPPGGKRTTGVRIAELADQEDRVVVTNDRDFRDGHPLAKSPRRILVVATGNITNAALSDLVDADLDAIVAAFEEADFVEVDTTALVVHPRRDGAAR